MSLELVEEYASNGREMSKKDALIKAVLVVKIVAYEIDWMRIE